MKRLTSVISILLVFTMLFSVSAAAADAAVKIPQAGEFPLGISEGINCAKDRFKAIGQNPVSGVFDNIKAGISQRIIDLLSDFLVKLEALYLKLGGTENDLREAEDIAVRLAALIESVASRSRAA